MLEGKTQGKEHLFATIKLFGKLRGERKVSFLSTRSYCFSKFLNIIVGMQPVLNKQV